MYTYIQAENAHEWLRKRKLVTSNGIQKIVRIAERRGEAALEDTA